MKNKERAWVNLGDVNFLEYGGCLVKPDEHHGAYNVISLTTPVYDYEGKYKIPCIVANCYIDLDTWLEEDTRKEVNDFAGFPKEYMPESESERMSYCVDLINYYGIQNFDPEFPEETGCGPYALGDVSKWIVGRTIVKRFLKENDVPYEYRH